MYSISPFVLEAEAAGDGCRIITPAGEASIVEANLVPALREIAAMQRCVERRTVGALLERYGLQASATEQFLRRISVLRPISINKDVVVFSRSPATSGALTTSMAENDAFGCVATTNLECLGSPRFLIAVQETYSPALVREIYAACSGNPDCIVLHAYFVFRHFVIDGLYCKSMRTSDHFAGLRKLAGRERQCAWKPISWVDFFLDEHGAIDTLSVPTFKASTLELSSALYILYLRLRPFMRPIVSSQLPDDPDTIIEMDLGTGRIDRH